MVLLRTYLLLGWLLLVGMTYWAVSTLGAEAGAVFFSDFAHAWRAQFNTDFLLHVLALAAWVFWRERSKGLGLLLALGTLLGGLFTLLYLLWATYAAHGDVRRLLLGHHAEVLMRKPQGAA